MPRYLGVMGLGGGAGGGWETEGYWDHIAYSMSEDSARGGDGGNYATRCTFADLQYQFIV